MIEKDTELTQRLVAGHRHDGRRKYDEAAKRELVEACLQPGISVAGMALRHGLNANLLRKWIVAYGKRGAMPAKACPARAPGGPAFIRVLEAKALSGVDHSRLAAQLPNGIRLDLGGLGREELSQILHVLGALPCSGVTRG